MSTKERKIDRFLRGLNHTLRCQLSTMDFPVFQTLVNKALIAEQENKTGYEERKCKYEPKKDNRENFSRKQLTWSPAELRKSQQVR